MRGLSGKRRTNELVEQPLRPLWRIEKSVVVCFRFPQAVTTAPNGVKLEYGNKKEGPGQTPRAFDS